MAATAFRAIRNLTLILSVAGLLAACETFPGAGSFGGGAPDYAAGQPISARLSGDDRAALAAAFTAAMDNGAQQNWRGKRANGAVVGAGYALAGLLPDENARMDAARGDFDLNVNVETDLGLHVLTRNSNVRIAPDAKAKIAEVLPSGTGVTVVGGVRGKNWMLIAVDGDVRGYVYGDLLIKAPGSELELAGGPVRKPLLCRNFRQRINSGSERAEWEGAACNDGTGWRIAREPAPDQNAPQELMEF
ncbi:MAG: SH3 domain-containing protein [Parvularculaceae bacterium]